ncbi:MAG: ABC transporter ATP-binding protein/permease [Oscillospiraceae bacterium]|nr:ABC transporter ATP-binding protein/permease [Oscillospiraceae bacterium]
MFQIKWLWKNLEGYRAVYICALIMTVIRQSMYIITPHYSSRIVDEYIYGEAAAENLAANPKGLIWLVAAMIGFTVLRTIITYTSGLCYEKASQGIVYRVRNHLFANVQRQDSEFFDKNRTGDLMTRISGDLDMVRHTIAWIIKAILECIVLYTASVFFFFSIDWLMALCMMALTPVIFAITMRLRKVMGPKYVVQREKLSGLNTAAEENISGNRVVKAFAREDFEQDKFDKLNKEYSDANKTTSLTWLKYYPFIEITAQGLAVVQLLAGGLFVIGGRITVGEYTAFSGLIWTMSNPMRMLGSIINDLERFVASLNKIIEIYYASPLITDRADAAEHPERLRGEIEFKNVSFSYDKKNPVLKSISFKIAPGETVAIMGPTGSGKTTLVNMISRTYDPDEGRILADGIDLRMMKLHELRRNIGEAQQDVLLFSDTIEGNIAFGRSDMPEEEVYKFAGLAAADGFIKETSDGYDTIIGERGVGLSGGQKQRISLARALAVRPAVLILDDTTSAVDMETERYIQNSLENLDFECTKIIIAQRISSAKNADKIIILKDGKIADIGTHKELTEREGYYKEVYDLQK